MKPDLFALARSNGPNLEAQLGRKRADLGESAKKLDEFCAAIQSAARVTINMGSNKLTRLIATDSYPTVYDMAREEAARTGCEPEDVLRERQGRFYAHRVRFDRYFADGESFIYGALNLRGVGPRYYGWYCVALKAPMDEGPLALLPGNSLEPYVDDTGENVDQQGVARDAGAWSHRAHVAACKHGEALKSNDPRHWPDMICSPDQNEQRFIEAILGDRVSRTRIEEIRIARDDAARLQHLLLRALTGEALTREEQLEHEGQLNVLEALARSGLTSLYREV
jgi:hypothetical protein